MRKRALLAACLTLSTVHAQQSDRGATILLVGAVHTRTLPASTPIHELLVRAKLKPQADLDRAFTLCPSRGFTAEPLDPREPLTTGRRAPLSPGDVLVVPEMPSKGREDSLIAILRGAVRRLAVSDTPSVSEVAIRLHLLRHAPDPDFRDLDRILELRGDALRLHRPLQDLARTGPPEVRRHAAAAIRRLITGGGICVGDCFPAGTSVQTPGGPRGIETIRGGDIVLDADSRARRVVKRHGSRALELVELDLGGERLRTTPGHRFLTRHRGWLAAAALQPGDALRSTSADLRIRGVRRLELRRPTAVYTLELAGAGAFAIGASATIVASKR